MEFKIITEEHNSLFNRKEIEAEMHSKSSPSREEIIKIISEKFSTDSEKIKIKTIKGSFGNNIFLIVANIYDSKADLNKYELKKKKDTREKKAESKETKQEESS